MAQVPIPSTEALQALKRDHEALRYEVQHMQTMLRALQGLGTDRPALFGVVDAAIAGTSDALSDPPSGTLNIYRITSTGGAVDTGEDRTVYNLSTVSRTTGEFTQVVRECGSGKWVAIDSRGGDDGYKRLCRFTLDAALAVSDASKAASITNQYGGGTTHASSAITVYNLLTHTPDVYLFEGDGGDAGLAYWDSGTSWRIIQMECP